MYAGVRVAWAIAGAATLALLGAQLSTRAHASTTSQIVDRTLVCSVGFGNGARVIDANVRSGYRSGNAMEWLAQAVITSPAIRAPEEELRADSRRDRTAGGLAAPAATRVRWAGIRKHAVRPDARSRLDVERRAPRGSGQRVWRRGAVSRRRRRSSFVRVRRSALPLPSSRARTARSSMHPGRIVRGQLAVRTLGGARLVYADATDAGNVRLFVGKACT